MSNEKKPPPAEPTLRERALRAAGAAVNRLLTTPPLHPSRAVVQVVPVVRGGKPFFDIDVDIDRVAEAAVAGIEEAGLLAAEKPKEKPDG